YVISFFFHAADGIRDFHVTGVQTCALPILISIPSYNAIDVIPQGKIVYCKSEGKYTNFYCLDKSVYTATKNIGEFERLLNPNLFYRVHNSFIVNIQYVDKIDKEGGGVCKLKDGREIPIAKRRKIHFYEFIGAIH